MSIKLELQVLVNKLRNKLDKPKKSEIIYTDEDGGFVQ